VGRHRGRGGSFVEAGLPVLSGFAPLLLAGEGCGARWNGSDWDCQEFRILAGRLTIFMLRLL
jgi:hypothetical protein